MWRLVDNNNKIIFFFPILFDPSLCYFRSYQSQKVSLKKRATQSFVMKNLPKFFYVGYVPRTIDKRYDSFVD